MSRGAMPSDKTCTLHVPEGCVCARAGDGGWSEQPAGTGLIAVKLVCTVAALSKGCTLSSVCRPHDVCLLQIKAYESAQEEKIRDSQRAGNRRAALKAAAKVTHSSLLCLLFLVKSQTGDR